MAAVDQKEDLDQVRAALILVNLRDRKLRRWPEWVPMPMQPPPGEASSSRPPGTVAKVLPPPSGQASSSARVVVPPRRRPERVISMPPQSGEASFLSLAGTVAAGVPERWPKARRSGSRGETSSKEPPEHGHAAAAATATADKGSGAPRSSEQERCAEMPAAASAQQRPVVAALCYATVAGSGTAAGPSTSAAPANKEEPMKSPSPKSPLDYGAGGGSSADDAARPKAKRKGTGGDDEGCSSPAKRGPAVDQEEEKPMPISVVQPSVQSETRASSGKGAPRPFDLNLLPCALDDDDDGCPNTN